MRCDNSSIKDVIKVTCPVAASRRNLGTRATLSGYSPRRRAGHRRGIINLHFSSNVARVDDKTQRGRALSTVALLLYLKEVQRDTGVR